MSPVFKFLGASIYIYSLLDKLYTEAMLAFLFGSYSIPIIIPTKSFCLKNSIFRYFFLWPQPLCLIVILPELFRPLKFINPFILFLISGFFLNVLYLIELNAFETV
jgi:hypothetical protein